MIGWSTIVQETIGRHEERKYRLSSKTPGSLAISLQIVTVRSQGSTFGGTKVLSTAWVNKILQTMPTAKQGRQGELEYVRSRRWWSIVAQSDLASLGAGYFLMAPYRSRACVRCRCVFSSVRVCLYGLGVILGVHFLLTSLLRSLDNGVQGELSVCLFCNPVVLTPWRMFRCGCSSRRGGDALVWWRWVKGNGESGDLLGVEVQ